METKKHYNKPQIETIVIELNSSIMEGSIHREDLDSGRTTNSEAYSRERNFWRD